MSHDFFGHIGYVFILAGMLALARQHISGWILRLVGEGIWTGIGFSMGMTSMWSWGIVFMCIDSYAFYHWRRASRPEGPQPAPREAGPAPVSVYVVGENGPEKYEPDSD